jgi:hypothetical protein
MELSLILGIGLTVVLLSGWVIASVLVHRHQRRIGEPAPLASADRNAVMRAQSLQNQATAAQMAAMSSAQRQ